MIQLYSYLVLDQSLISDQMYEGFLVYGFNLMKSIVKCEDYATPLSGGINEGTQRLHVGSY